jgi:hypothetical protein
MAGSSTAYGDDRAIPRGVQPQRDRRASIRSRANGDLVRGGKKQYGESIARQREELHTVPDFT